MLRRLLRWLRRRPDSAPSLRREVDEPSVLTLDGSRFYIGVGATLLMYDDRVVEVGPDGEVREWAAPEGGWSITTLDERSQYDRQSYGGRGPAEYQAIEKARRG